MRILDWVEICGVHGRVEWKREFLVATRILSIMFAERKSRERLLFLKGMGSLAQKYA